MNTRIKAIAEAATSLFLSQGYARTQISHIAKAAGVSVGTIYHDFAGKQEIMHFILKCMIDPDFINREFNRPITDDLFKNIDAEMIAQLKEIETGIARHLVSGLDHYSFEALIQDTFDLLARYAVGCLFIEKNQYDFLQLSAPYKAFRKEFFLVMKGYLEAFIKNGAVRQLEQPELSATMIIEILSWWAMDRRYVSFETSAIPLDVAKQACLDNILSAYQK